MRHALIAALLVVVAGVAHADPVQWTLASGGNDHWYAAISSTQMVTWDAANAAAGAAGGYLATLTSAAENAFVWELVMPSVRPDLWSGYLWDPNWLFFGPWLGGYQDPYGSPNSDNWYWVTGEKWEYTNWYSGQPDHYIGVGGTEDRLNFLGGGSEWNDLDGDGESAADDHARVRGGVQPGARHWRCYPGAVHLGPAGLQRALRGGGAAAAAEGVDAEASGDAARAAHGLGGSRCWQGKQVGGRPSARDRGRPPSIGDRGPKDSHRVGCWGSLPQALRSRVRTTAPNSAHFG